MVEQAKSGFMMRLKVNEAAALAKYQMK